MNKAEKEFILKIKNMPCCICNASAPSEADHVTDRGRRLGHEWLIPLCVSCHRGQNGYTSHKCTWDKSSANQFKLCKKTYEKLGLVMPMPYSKLPNYYERMLEE
jgi:hypothetical protein